MIKNIISVNKKFMTISPQKLVQIISKFNGLIQHLSSSIFCELGIWEWNNRVLCFRVFMMNILARVYSSQDSTKGRFCF